MNSAQRSSDAPEQERTDRQEQKAPEGPQDAAGCKAETPDADRAAAETGPADQKAADRDEKAENQETGDKAAGQKEKEKTVSETDVLKIYLKQSMAEIKRLKGELETVRREKETQDADNRNIREKYNSLAHEYENYRRRTAEEKAGIHDDAVAQVVTSLLPALDNLERAMDFASSNAESFQKGVEMTFRQLADGFKKLGVEEIEAQNQPFDPKIHSAVMHVEDDKLGDSVVADVFQKGYRIGDRVIRHSMVKVAN